MSEQSSRFKSTMEKYSDSSSMIVGNINSSSSQQKHTSLLENDERMSSLMSMFKRREVNPAEYDAKMRFWTDYIVESSSTTFRNPFFTMKQLNSRFQRNNRLPACLETVIREMESRGQILPTDEYAKQIGQQGWINWSVDVLIKRPISWIWSSSAEPNFADKEFVLPSVVQEIAEDILKKRRDAVESDKAEDDPMAQDVVPFSTIRRAFRTGAVPIVEDRALEFALSYLQYQRQIAVEISGGGKNSSKPPEKLIKFKSANESEPPKMTETDRQILEVKRATANLEQELSNMDQQVARLTREARDHVQAKNQTKAKACLRQKLNVVKRMKEKETAFDNLSGIMMQLAQTKEQRAIFDAYKAGVSAFKNNLAKHGLSPENVDKTMDDIHEALSDHEDIRQAIASGPIGFGGAMDTSQEDLEAELNELMAEDEKKKHKSRAAEKRAIRLPDIPDSDDEQDEEEDQQEDRLKRLRRALETS